MYFVVAASQFQFLVSISLSASQIIVLARQLDNKPNLRPTSRPFPFSRAYSQKLCLPTKQIYDDWLHFYDLPLTEASQSS